MGIEEWLGTARGRLLSALFALFLLVLLIGLSLAGVDFAIGLLFTYVGLAVGPAAAYPVSLLLARRGFRRNRGHVRGLLVVWIVYVLVLALLIAAAPVAASVNPRAAPSGTAGPGFVQGFGPSFWLLLMYRLRRSPRTADVYRRWVLAALGLYASGTALALVIGILASIYALGPPTR